MASQKVNIDLSSDGEEDSDKESNDYDEEDSEEVPDEHESIPESIIDVPPPKGLPINLTCAKHHGQLVHSYLVEKVKQS